MDEETITACAARITEAYSRGTSIAPLTDEFPDLTEAQAYDIAEAVRHERERAGDRVVGWKIGFTNRTIWDQYGVHAPIWGPMYASTTRAFEQPGREGAEREPAGSANAPGARAAGERAAGEWPVAGLTEPQVEAEIAFRFSSAPRAGADERELLESIDGVSHTLEVVRCPYPDWVFRPADTMAAAGLHGGLAVGPWHSNEPAERDDWARALTTFGLTIRGDDGVEGTGQAQNVLGGPLSALQHFIDESARLRGGVLIRPGDIVTTGTVPPAYPLRAGQHWTTEVDGLPLPGLSLTAV